MKILVLNGPNLNLVGVREKEIYGDVSFDHYMEALRRRYPEDELDYYQSNVEGFLIDKIQEAGYTHDGIIFNGGGFTHTSVALADAIAAVPAFVVEVHISNPHRREAFRHHSMLSRVCRGVIAGFGLSSYDLALQAIRDLHSK